MENQEADGKEQHRFLKLSAHSEWKKVNAIVEECKEFVEDEDDFNVEDFGGYGQFKSQWEQLIQLVNSDQLEAADLKLKELQATALVLVPQLEKTKQILKQAYYGEKPNKETPENPN